jgi:hypothetical protein
LRLFSAALLKVIEYIKTKEIGRLNKWINQEDAMKLLHCDKSRQDLGWNETVKYFSAKLTTCHPSNVEVVKRNLALAEAQAGKTLFELIVDIIEGQDYIELSLQ